MEEKVIQLPSELAALLGVGSVDEAVLEISKLQLSLDNEKRNAKELEERLLDAEEELYEHLDKQVIDKVDRLIASGQITENKRDAAITLARKDKLAFDELYPAKQEAPKAKLLERIVKEDKLPKSAPVEMSADYVVKRVAELKNGGMDHFEAYSVVLNELRKGVS